jgi:hypothetical protein
MKAHSQTLILVALSPPPMPARAIPEAGKLSPASLALTGTTITALCSLGAALPANAAVVANYQFQNTLSSTIPTAPDLLPFVQGTYAPAVIGGTPTTVYNFGRNEGLPLDTTSLLISDNYTIAALFSFDAISGYRRILDFKNRTSDTGLYTLNGQLNFYNQASGGPAVGPGTFFEAVLSRDSSTNLVSAYFNGTPVFSFTDSSSLGVISAAKLLNIFQDDLATPGEASSGSVAGMRIFDNVLTDAEVADLDLLTPSAPPESQVPAPLPLLGFGAAFSWSRGLRRRLRSSTSPG